MGGLGPGRGGHGGIELPRQILDAIWYHHEAVYMYIEEEMSTLEAPWWEHRDRIRKFSYHPD